MTDVLETPKLSQSVSDKERQEIERPLKAGPNSSNQTPSLEGANQKDMLRTIVFTLPPINMEPDNRSLQKENGPKVAPKRQVSC